MLAALWGVMFLNLGFPAYGPAVIDALLMATVVTGGLGAMLCCGLLVGTGVATGAALASEAGLARWFVRRRSLALSVLYSASAIGGFVAAPLLNRIIQATGSWRA